MKKILSLVLVLGILGGCSMHARVAGEPQYGSNNGNYQLAAGHWGDVTKIRNEFSRLSDLVRAGKLTKVQAAQYINRYRLKEVGSNEVDDSIYEIYLRSAVDSQRGQISSDQAKVYLQQALAGWQQRWPSMHNKPANPAFTNALLEMLGMRTLQ